MDRVRAIKALRQQQSDTAHRQPEVESFGDHTEGLSSSDWDTVESRAVTSCESSSEHREVLTQDDNNNNDTSRILHDVEHSNENLNNNNGLVPFNKLRTGLDDVDDRNIRSWNVNSNVFGASATTVLSDTRRSAQPAGTSADISYRNAATVPIGEMESYQGRSKKINKKEHVQITGDNNRHDALVLSTEGSEESSGYEDLVRVRIMLESSSEDNAVGRSKLIQPSFPLKRQIADGASNTRVVHQKTTRDAKGKTTANDSVNFIREMKSYLGLLHESSSDYLSLPSSSCSPVEFPQQIFDNMRLLRRNRENIKAKLDHFRNYRNTVPVVGDHYAIGLSNGSVATRQGLPGAVTQVEGGVVNPSIDSDNLSSTDNMSVMPSSSLESNSSSASRVLLRDYTPVRVYSENVKQDGTGRRPMRKRDKFELQKKLVVENYVKRLLQTKQSELAQLTQSTVDGSAIDVSSSRVLNKLMQVDTSVSVTDSSADAGPSIATSSSPDNGVQHSSGQRYERFEDSLLDRVPSRLSDIEEMGRRAAPNGPASTQGLSSDGSSVEVQSRSVQVPSADSGRLSCDDKADAQVQTSLQSISNASNSSDNDVSNQKPGSGAVSSLSVSTPSFTSYDFIHSSSSISIPSFPSTSTPTVVSSAAVPSGRVSRLVSPIVNSEDATETDARTCSRGPPPAVPSQEIVSNHAEHDAHLSHEAGNVKRNHGLLQNGVERSEGYTGVPCEISSTTDVKLIPGRVGKSLTSGITSLGTTDSESSCITLTQEEILTRQQEIYHRLTQLNEIKKRYLHEQHRHHLHSTHSADEVKTMLELVSLPSSNPTSELEEHHLSSSLPLAHPDHEPSSDHHSPAPDHHSPPSRQTTESGDSEWTTTIASGPIASQRLAFQPAKQLTTS